MPSGKPPEQTTPNPLLLLLASGMGFCAAHLHPFVAEADPHEWTFWIAFGVIGLILLEAVRV